MGEELNASQSQQDEHFECQFSKCSREVGVISCPTDGGLNKWEWRVNIRGRNVWIVEGIVGSNGELEVNVCRNK
jgi:hypothetical protein